jgi:hypothetical protein
MEALMKSDPQLGTIAVNDSVAQESFMAKILRGGLLPAADWGIMQ